MTEWTLDLGEAKPLSMNGREHWRTRARLTANIRRLAHALALQANIPPLDYVEIELHYAPRDKRRRDSLNLVPTLKACEDGIVDARVIPDDTPEYIRPLMPVLDLPTGKPGRIYVLIREAVRGADVA